MLKVTINKEAQDEGALQASRFEFGQLFRDSDGDLYIRCDEGAVRFENDELVPYTEAELNDFEQFGYLKVCTPAQGTITIQIKVVV